MGLGFKLLAVFGTPKQKRKMKEKKSDSFFLFRKNVSRYSFLSDKKKSETNNVQIQRLSWSSFPNGKSPIPEEIATQDSLPCSRSKSSDNLKKQAKHAKKLTKSKSSIFKSSSSTVKSMFTLGSSSPSASSASSSTSSSPKVRQSWSSGVTHILERCGNDSQCGNGGVFFDFDRLNENGSSFVEPSYPILSGHMTEGSTGKQFCTRTGFPVGSLLEADEEDEIMITPKIICAHKKTPDVIRKTRKQILLELEYIKEMGMFPEELETQTDSKEEENTDIIFPADESLSCLSGDLNFNSLRGFKSTLVSSEQTTDAESETISDTDTQISKSQSKQEILGDLFSQGMTITHQTTGSQESGFLNSLESTGEDSDDNEYFGTFRVMNPSNGASSHSPSTPAKTSLHDYSEDESDTMTNADEDESSSFEKRLEANLESLDERGNENERGNESSSSSEEVEKVQLRRKIKPQLHIDINKARGIKTFSNERLLLRMGIDPRDSNGSSVSSPRTPRSPAIDIDDLFKQRQKKIEEGSKDSLTLVKDLAQRLRLPTKPPSHVEWLNGIKDKAEARQLAEAMSPMVLESSDGVFHLQETLKIPTEQQRKKNISNALLWIKDELIKMKKQDEHLARQLIQLQMEMQRIRLLRSCTQHEALLEEVTCEEEEQRALMTTTDLLDLPNSQREGAFSSLRDFGVTRMNLADRRFTLR